MSKSKSDEKQPTFAQAIEQLETIITEIEDGEVDLEESIERYEKGIALIKSCRTILAQAEQKIQKLTEADSGQLTPDGELDDLDQPEQ
jgi:exodeoxyribonuclease VII small subunit